MEPGRTRFRPTYETDLDLAGETTFAKYIEQKFDCTLHKLPISYHIDFAAIRDGYVMGWVETKIRNVASTDFDFYVLSFIKFKALRNFARTSGKASVLAIKWTDRSGFYHIPLDQNFEFKIGGRTKKTRDPADIEVMVEIPIKDFKFFD